MQTALIELKNIQRKYGKLQVLQGLTLNVGKGERVLLLGANGAGKSTLLKVIAGIIGVDNGDVLIDGSPTDLGRVGYSGHKSLLYAGLTVRENLSLQISLRGIKNDIDTVLDRWELHEISEKTIDTLSQGQEARVGLARAMLGDPKVLLLDEPSSALDESGIHILSREIENLSSFHGGELAVLIATHDIARLKSIASRIVVLNDGKILSDTADSSGVEYLTVREEIIARYLTVNR